ncbi:hypothetical protein B0H63DRAFT_517740 [Podospora didyma]|uniref:Uncharacterized protein n=1 Tax=Podospora didyma TaxID=330526 RepID=A0AAE0P7D0_9PEZI|nr:hypothetical protein B0H63DRAFT_517740 [Podospora didyma]
MPAVNVAMERSLRDGFIDLLAASLRPLGQLYAGDILQMARHRDDDNRRTDTSVNHLVHMSMSLLRALLLLLMLPIRAKYLDDPYPPPNQKYQPQPPMDPNYSRGPTVPPISSRAHGVPELPQYAEFDVKKPGAPVHEDALPAMPTWEGAESTKKLVEGEDVELEQLKKPEASSQNASLKAGAVPGAVAGRSSGHTSPNNIRSPYGAPAGNMPNTSGYFPPGAVEADPYGQHLDDHHQAGSAYNQPGSAYSEPTLPVIDQGYGVAGAAMVPGRRSPRRYDDGAYNDTGYGQGRGYPPARQGTYNAQGMSRQGSFDTYGTPQSTQGYGMGSRRSPYDAQGSTYPQGQTRRSPAPQGGYSSQSDYPPRRDYNAQEDYSAQEDLFNSYGDTRPAAGRQYSTDSTRPLNSAPSQRQQARQQYAHEMPANPTPSSQYQNVGETAGFDFSNSGYSRPSAAPLPAAASMNNGGGYRQPSPVLPQQESQYPGYKPYQPSSQQQQNGW